MRVEMAGWWKGMEKQTALSHTFPPPLEIPKSGIPTFPPSRRRNKTDKNKHNKKP
jgi:hypothetical protein